MGIKCFLRGHRWKDCKCEACGQSRNYGHVWQGCVCSVCRAQRDTGHVTEGCRCTVCGREVHDWAVQTLTCADICPYDYCVNYYGGGPCTLPQDGEPVNRTCRKCGRYEEIWVKDEKVSPRENLPVR